MVRKIAYREHLEQGLLRDYEALELLLLLDRHVGYFLKSGVIGINDWPVTKIRQCSEMNVKFENTHLSWIAIS